MYGLYNKIEGVSKSSMSPRPYRLGQRQAATELTRAHMSNAARELLMSSNGYSLYWLLGITVPKQAVKRFVENLARYVDK